VTPRGFCSLVSRNYTRAIPISFSLSLSLSHYPPISSRPRTLPTDTSQLTKPLARQDTEPPLMGYGQGVPLLSAPFRPAREEGETVGRKGRRGQAGRE